MFGENEKFRLYPFSDNDRMFPLSDVVTNADEKIQVTRRLSTNVQLRRSDDVCLALRTKHMVGRPAARDGSGF